MDTPNPIVPVPEVENLIYLIRGCRVMVDADLARLYGVETGALNRAVKRNADRFPEDFMFRLTPDESKGLRCQIGISKKRRGGRRFLPLVFTEQGVAMLSGVLASKHSVRVNVEIVRAFVHLRRMVSMNVELAAKLAELERKSSMRGKSIRNLFKAIKELMAPPEPPRPPIGFRPGG
jgi:hypothetical protein